MGLFTKKDNGINWQKEVFETSKILPTVLEKLETIGNGFNNHVAAGRKQREEDKQWQSQILEKSLECVKGKQVDVLQSDVDDLKLDKQLKKGKILGIKLIYAIILGALGFIALVLGIFWRLHIL